MRPSVTALTRWFRRKPAWDIGLRHPNQGASNTEDTVFDQYAIPELAPNTLIDETVFTENMALIDEQESLQEQADALRGEVSRLKTVLDQLGARREVLLADRENTVKQTRQQKEKLEQEIANITTDIERNGTVVAQLQKRSDQLAAERKKIIEARKAELAALQREADQLENDIEVNHALLAELQPLRQQLQEKEQLRATLEQSIAQATATLVGLKSTAHTTSEQVHLLEAHLNEERQNLALLNAEAGNLEQRQAALQQLQHQRAHELASVQEHLMAIENELQEKQTALHNQAAELKALQANIKQQEAERQALESHQQGLAERLDTLRQQANEPQLNVNYTQAAPPNTSELLSPLTLEVQSQPLFSNEAPTRPPTYRFMVFGCVLVGLFLAWLYHWFNQGGANSLPAPQASVAPQPAQVQPTAITPPELNTFQLSTELGTQSQLILQNRKSKK